MRLALSSILLLALAFVLFSYYVSQPLEEGRRSDFMPIIADRDIALTFARSPLGLILVTEHLGDAIRGINLPSWYGEEQTKDLINFLALTDRDVLIALDAAEEQIDLNSLIMPSVTHRPRSQQEPISRNTQMKFIRRIRRFSSQKSRLPATGTRTCPSCEDSITKLNCAFSRCRTSRQNAKQLNSDWFFVTISQIV